MEGTMIGFAIWSVIGCLMIAAGIFAFFSRRAVGFWANGEVIQVTDIRKYNRAMGKLFCAFGIAFIFLGLPLLSGQNSAWILLSVVGVMAETILTMIIYTTVIEKKYKK